MPFELGSEDTYMRPCILLDGVPMLPQEVLDACNKLEDFLGAVGELAACNKHAGEKELSQADSYINVYVSMNKRLAAMRAENEKLRGLLQKWYDERSDHYDADSCCLHLETAEALGEDAEA